jgi:hypothetical protein
MRIHELTEAISVTKLFGPLKQSIKAGLVTAIGNLTELKDGFPRLEKLLKLGDTEPFKKQMAYMLDEYIPDALRKQIKKDINKIYGSSIVKTVDFREMGEENQAFVSGRSISVNVNTAKALSRQIAHRLMDITESAYSENDYVNGFFAITESIGNKEKEHLFYLFDRSNETIEKLASILVHELVHVIQNNQQELKGIKKNDSEYRSYLDTRKGEFRDMVDKRWASNNVNPEEDEKYYNMYMASPQEISAFSHEIALYIIEFNELNDATTVEELNELVRGIESQQIVQVVSEFIQHRFRDPKNIREYAVFKRYVKLVYQELNRYIDTLRENLRKK